MDEDSILDTIKSPPTDPEEFVEWMGMLSKDNLDFAILVTTDTEVGDVNILKELMDEKFIRETDPANSARAKALQKMLDRIGRENRDYTK